MRFLRVFNMRSSSSKSDAFAEMVAKTPASTKLVRQHSNDILKSTNFESYVSYQAAQRKKTEEIMQILAIVMRTCSAVPCC